MFFLSIISSNWNNSDLLWDSKAEKHPEFNNFVWSMGETTLATVSSRGTTEESNIKMALTGDKNNSSAENSVSYIFFISGICSF